MRTLSFFSLALLTAWSPLASAADLLPADRPIEQVIDHYIEARLQQEKVVPAGQIDDANLIRRLTLDLNGRIPTAAEVQAFVRSTDPAKRAKLIDRLMASPAFVRHQATEFDTMLMAGTNASIRDYLLKAFANNRSWDRIFRELLLPDENDPQQQGASAFMKPRLTDLDKLTNDVSVAFFGVNVSCARCHDHPLVPDWKQDHFFGMKAFFNRTFDNGGFLGERGYGVLKFKTTKGVEKQAKMMFLTGKVIEAPASSEPSNEEQKKEKAALEEAKRKKKAPPAPSFSARAQLVKVALEPEQRDFFARALVNRLWLRLHGHGLVAPLDQMHSENAPSHPELLTWLARDTVAHGYDVRRLLRGLVMSKTYSRSSRWDGEVTPALNLFAVARVRPLTPMQMATSLRLATSDPASFAADRKPQEVEKKIEQLEGSASGFARLIEQPHEDFQISVSEALLFSNNDRVLREFLAEGGDRLLTRLKQARNPREVIDLAVRNVCSRDPRPEEIPVLVEYLSKRADRPTEAQRQLIWALLTSAEFRFNY